jgi:hypothetical protein
MSETRKIRKPDLENEDPKYWEGVLESHGLGIRQLGLQEEPPQTDNGTLEEADGGRPKNNS